jgi:hypothetical protein
MLPDYAIIPQPALGFIMVFQIVLGIGCFILGITSIFYMKKAEMKSRKNYYFGLLMIFLLIGISRIVFFYHDFIAPIELDIILWKIASIIMLLGFTIISYVIETYIYKKTKHFITIIGIIFTILYAIMLDKNLATLFLYIANGSMLFLPFILYLAMAINTTGDIRKKSLIIVVGMAILLVGSALGVFVLAGLMDKTTSLILGPPIMLVGFVIVWYGFTVMSR